MLTMIDGPGAPVLRPTAQIPSRPLDRMSPPPRRPQRSTLTHLDASADRGLVSSSLRRLATTVLVAGTCAFGALVPSAHAANPLAGLLGSKSAPAPVAPVADPITLDPDYGSIRGTVIMVHAGGWAGHDANAQNILMTTPGTIFHERGWRVVSIDYNEGTAGLADVLNAARDELARSGGRVPLCIYGESAGAQLALVAAAQFRSIDCVIGLGAPTDLPLYEQEEADNGDSRIQLVLYQAERFFGTAPADIAPWNPIDLVAKIHADVMLMHEGDDTIVPLEQATLFAAARPTTQVVSLEAGDPNDPADKFVHGTISAAGRQAYAAAIGAFADRAVASRAAELKAQHTGCAQTSRTLTEIGKPQFVAALRCLARKDTKARRASVGSWRSTSLRVHGELDAARLWSDLRASKSGMRALAAAARSRSSVTVQPSDPSRVVLRARH
jgi:acetyl esterase/lipase